jgi:hypothetical protein
VATKTLLLPEGNEHTELVNLPLCGSWLGLVRVGIACPVDATIHEWLFIAPNVLPGKTGFRRTALASTNNYYNSVLHKDQLEYRWLAQQEALMRITYTATSPIGVIYETNRNIGPAPYPQLTEAAWNISSAAPWNGANTAGDNPTEKAAGMPGQLNGLVYWKAA